MVTGYTDNYQCFLFSSSQWYQYYLISEMKTKESVCLFALVFPAAILQPPFFHKDAPKYVEFELKIEVFSVCFL